MSARLISPEAPLLGLLVATLLGPLHMVVPLSVHCWWTLCSSMFPLKDISQTLFRNHPNSLILTCMLVAQSCLTQCNPMDCSPPGSSVHGILQARILEWVAMPSSRASFQPGIKLCLLHLLHWQVGSIPLATQEVHLIISGIISKRYNNNLLRSQIIY